MDEVSREVFRILVEDQRAMSFTPVPDALLDDDDQIDSSQPLPALLEEMYGEGRHTDTKLQTKLIADRLDKRLLKISTEASTYFQEQGVDILYLALGFLTWFENKNSDKPRKAPLVLIPVYLERPSAKERYKVVYTQADLGPNLSLGAKLKMEFRLDLPEFSEELNFEDYLAEVSERIQDQPRWHVNADEMALGFFSFGRFQMYQDLDPKNWPESKKPGSHSVLKGLLGEGFDPRAEGSLGIGSAIEGGRALDLVDLHFVKDADSSQTQAVMAIKNGSNLVIQGPPGTGKSQTITNIISESLADGKTVLFVAEKMAALEVVKRRLDECHLGDAVLELHSNKSNKRAVLEELKRTLELGAPAVVDRAPEKRRHIQLQEQLDAYCSQVNETILKSGVSYIDALGHHLKLKEEAGDHVLPELDFQTMQDWDQTAFFDACMQVQELVDHLEMMGVPAESPFAQSSLEDFSPVAQNQIVTRLEKSLELLADCQKLGASLATEMGLKIPQTLTDVDAICRAAERTLDAPHLEGITLTTDDWQQRRDQIKELLTAGAEMSSLKQQRASQLIDQAWKADLLSTRQAWVTSGKHWWRFLSGDFRQAKRTLQGLLKGELPKEAEACVELIDDILKYQTMSEKYATYERLGESLFRAQWQGRHSDWKVLRVLTDWIVELYQEVGKGEVPEGILRFLEGGTSLAGWGEHLGVTLSDQRDGIDELILDDLATTLGGWLQNIDDLYQMARYNCLSKALSGGGLELIDQISFNWSLPPALLLTTLKAARYEGLVNEAYGRREALRGFDRINHESVISEFKRSDSNLFHHAQEVLIAKLHENTPSVHGAGEMAIIRREMNKKRRHIPIRRLTSLAGRAIQQIKPVFMMSPMSVATYLEQGSVDFDLVIFDEASQVKVVDALGSILRGKQVVVVGDMKQMPPTDFFGKALELDDEDADESQTADIESILSMFLSKGAPESMLRWHYRSRHDSLITVSNQEFYDGKLMIFPSPGVNPQAKGLEFRLIPESIYERGGSRTNPIEARAIAEAVMEHARTSPHLTLGAVAFSTAQRDCILLEVERLRREDPRCEDFFSSKTLEGFFVKNLENVQGDERDTIFISIGYGRTSSGSVSKSFGPINRDGGERRLNVLITRARLAMKVFCNFTADELDTKSDSPFGVRALKNFLRYAETGELENRHETGKDTDSPFEDEVISAIRQLGYDVEPQVGSAGFYIDIAVRDPEKPGRYILAVECDGASYHSSASARDRDRLRQDVLEGIGWRFHRIWSTDWFRNSHKEIQRLKDSIEKAIRFYSELDKNGFIENAAGNQSEPQLVAPKIQRTEARGIDKPVANLYSLANGNFGIAPMSEIHELNLDVVAGAVKKMIDIEGPVHIKDAAKRITESAGYSRVGNRIMTHIERAVKHGHRLGKFHAEKEFIYHDNVKKVDLRDRSNLAASKKKIEHVPAEEVTEALIIAVGMAFSLVEDDSISEALSLMGFQRSTAKAQAYVKAILQEAVKNGRLKIEGGIATAA